MGVDVIKELKESVIDDFYTYLKFAKKAQYLDISTMLNKILFIETAANLDSLNSKLQKFVWRNL